MKQLVFIDDEEHIISGLKRSLREMRDQWSMSFFTDPLQSLDKIKENKPDIIITDYRMPQIGGIEFLQELKSLSPQSKIIVLSGQSDEKVFETIKQLSDGYLSKPCGRDEIISMVNSLM